MSLDSLIPGSRREIDTTDVTAGLERHCLRTAFPTQPVLPVIMIFIGNGYVTAESLGEGEEEGLK